MCQLKKEHRAQITEQKAKDQSKLKELREALPKAWNDTPRYLELLRQQRIIEGRIHLAKLKLENLRKGKEVLAA
jgi:hypothetical protein